jgi:hypothetical protein
MFRIAGPLRLLPCALVALALIVATSAWSIQYVGYGPDEVASAAAPAGHEQAPHPDRQACGHDHLQGFSFPVAALPDGTELAPPPVPAAAPPAVRVATLALRPADPPLPDPPRTA